MELTYGMLSLCVAICQHVSKLIVQDDHFPFAKFVGFSTRPITDIILVNVQVVLLGRMGRRKSYCTMANTTPTFYDMPLKRKKVI